MKGIIVEIMPLSQGCYNAKPQNTVFKQMARDMLN